MMREWRSKWIKNIEHFLKMETKMLNMHNGKNVMIDNLASLLKFTEHGSRMLRDVGIYRIGLSSEFIFWISNDNCG